MSNETDPKDEDEIQEEIDSIRNRELDPDSDLTWQNSEFQSDESPEFDPEGDF